MTVRAQRVDEDELTEQSWRDPRAFAALYEAHFPRIFNYVRYRVRRRDLADDLTARTFLKAMEHFRRFDPAKAAFGAWLLVIARNLISDHLRAERRWRWISFDWLRERPSERPDPEELAIDSETRRYLLAAVARLTDRERDILGLRFAGGRSNHAIAEMTGFREGHVAVIVFRALGKLRAELIRAEVRHV